MTNPPPSSGKTHRDENFPVASMLIAPRHRAAILAFYRFARAADDIADDPALAPEQKLKLLDAMEATLRGANDAMADALPLRAASAERGLALDHPLDLLTAFRADAVKSRCADWDDLMNYCRHSAAPVGRFVLDVHGESRACWPANDALCSALQVINHLQDCGDDYKALDRVYVPLDVMARHGVAVDALAAPAASPALRAVLASLAERTDSLLAQSAAFSGMISDFRLALEVSVIQLLARRLNALLRRRDPLSENVHLTKPQMLLTALVGVASGARRRIWQARAGAPPA